MDDVQFMDVVCTAIPFMKDSTEITIQDNNYDDLFAEVADIFNDTTIDLIPNGKFDDINCDVLFEDSIYNESVPSLSYEEIDDISNNLQKPCSKGKVGKRGKDKKKRTIVNSHLRVT